MRIATKVSNTITLGDTIEKFMVRKKADSLAKKTMDDYRRELNRFLKSSSNSMDVRVLEDEVIKYFGNIPNTSAAVFNRPYSCLKAFFNWCVDMEYLPYSPIAKAKLKKRHDDSEIHAASIDDIKAVLAACDQSSFTGLRNYTIILVMLDTGIRTAELTRLVDSDYDPCRRTILVRKQNAKTKKERTCYLSDETAIAINRYLQYKPDSIEWLFPSRDSNQMDTNEIGREIRKLCGRAGVKFTPYQLRHAFATYFVQNGGNVFVLQKLMGHSDLKLTLRYTDISESQKKEAHEAFSPINQITPKKRLSLS